MPYLEEAYLDLSGLQHFAYCRRQWALIHVEGLWQENLRTLEGHFLHERAHDAELTEKRGDLLVVRGLPVSSAELGVSGICDVVEFHADPRGVTLAGWPGLWQPCPVEYKRGSPKVSDADRLQLCCQAMCLEEMLLCPTISQADLFYGQTRRREQVALDAALRQTVGEMLQEMHAYQQRQYTPQAKPTKGCNACSLKGLCLPKLSRRTGSARAYVDAKLEEME